MQRRVGQFVGTSRRSSSTYALCNVTLPYVLRLANQGLAALTATEPEFAHAINLHAGKVTNQAVAEMFGLSYSPFGG